MLQQQSRVAQLTTPLGENVLALVQFHGHEGMSELFEFEVEALSEEADLDFDKAIGRACHIEMNVEYFGKRSFNGLLTEARWLGMRDSYYLYKITLRPWAWLLGKTTDCRIFHDKTVIDIIQDVFQKGGFSDYRMATTESYRAMPYTVQYRETALNFVCRLMEQHGIYFFFEHSAANHMLVLADSRSSHTPAPGLGDVVYSPLGDESRKSRQPHIFDWHSERSFRTGKFELNDYHHVTPNARLVTNRAEPQKYAHGDLENYDHPGVYSYETDGRHYVKMRLEAEQAKDHTRSASGLAIPLFPGCTFNLARHPRGSENGQYLVTHVTHSLRPQQYRSNADTDENPYKASFKFLKQTQNYRAPHVTQKPLIHSMHTAIVASKSGGEIDCDDHGRILVHFYWDRNNDVSCRVRVSQMWAGNNWGAQVIPRTGMEVMVAFIDGDPDRPIVVGCVPDPQNNKVPYSLPDNKTRMTIKSKSYGRSGFNELRFEDKGGDEEIYVHAQKDVNIKILHDSSTVIDNDSKLSVGNDLTEKITNDAKEDVGKNKTINVGTKITIKCGASTLTMDSSGNISIKGIQISIEAAQIALKAGKIDLN